MCISVVIAETALLLVCRTLYTPYTYKTNDIGHNWDSKTDNAYTHHLSPKKPT